MQLGDAITSAYARKPPLVTNEDLAYYFRTVGLHIPDFAADNLGVILDQHIPRSAADGFISHETLVSSTTILACWLATAQREFALLSTCALSLPIYLSRLAADTMDPLL